MLRQVKSATPIYPVRATPALESTAAAPVRRELLRSLRFESSARPATGVGHKVNDTCCPSEGLRPLPTLSRTMNRGTAWLVAVPGESHRGTFSRRRPLPAFDDYRTGLRPHTPNELPHRDEPVAHARGEVRVSVVTVPP